MEFVFLEEKSESLDSNIKIRDIKSLSKKEILQICDLLNQLEESGNELQKQFNMDLIPSGKFVWGESTFDKLINMHNPSFMKLFAYEEENEICGILFYKEYKEDSEYKNKTGWISSIVVDKDKRGKGIGKNLMKSVKKWVKKNRKVTHIFLGVITSNKQALKLYNEMKFIPLSQTMGCKL